MGRPIGRNTKVKGVSLKPCVWELLAEIAKHNNVKQSAMLETLILSHKK